MKLEPSLRAAMLALAVALPATVLAIEEPHTNTGQAEAAGKSGAEKPAKKDDPMKTDAPAGDPVLNFEELFGCKPMEGVDGHDHAREKR